MFSFYFPESEHRYRVLTLPWPRTEVISGDAAPLSWKGFQLFEVIKLVLKCLEGSGLKKKNGAYILDLPL